MQTSGKNKRHYSACSMLYKILAKISLHWKSILAWLSTKYKNPALKLFCSPAVLAAIPQGACLEWLSTVSSLLGEVLIHCKSR